MRPVGRSWPAIALAFVACSSRAPQMPGDGSTGAPPDAATIDAMPDADCSCSVAPAPRCIDAMTLESSRAPGTCTAGSCAFDTFRSTCLFGCASGACQPAACTPSCPAQVCADDGCGGSCGPCPTDTTFPGVAPVPLGIARDLRVAPDGTHVATMRALEPRCGTLPLDMGRMDVWTVGASGAPSHRTIGAHAPLFAMRFTDDGYLVYNDRADLCALLGDLWVARADGRDPIQLATGTFLGPTVAGHWVYYTAPDPEDPPPMPGQLLYAARLPDGAPRLVTHMPSGSFDTVSPTGDAVWVTRTTPEPNLILFRVDGSFTPLVAAPIEVAGTPLWAPDGKRLAYAQFDRRIGKTSLYVIDTAGGKPSLLTDDCGCGALDSVAFAPDGSRIAWLVAPGFGAPVDAVIHRFAGGPDVRLTGVVLPNSGGEVFRLAFSADGSRLYAAVGDISTSFQMMSGRVDTPGAAVSLGSLRSDGDRFATSWDETRDGTVLAFNGGDSATHVIGPGGMQSIAGIPLERPRFERTLTNPRLLVQQGIALSLFPTSGAGPGIPLPGFDWTDQLSAWVLSGEVPFAFGWSGPVALYPSAVQGSTPFVVVQDLMAWTPSAQGRLSSRVIRYRIVDDPARIYLITQDQALTMVPRPSIAPAVASPPAAISRRSTAAGPPRH